MKLLTAWVMSAGLMLTAAAADAQLLAPNPGGVSHYSAVADVDGPYAAMPRDEPAPGYGPRLLPAPEVYTVVRENGFSPLGAPQLRGMFYTIAVLGRGGDDGRLVIDARDGRVVRFVPAWRTGGNFHTDVAVAYGPPGSPPVSVVRGPPRPPALIPHVANRTVPLPRATPQRPGEPPIGAKPADSTPQSIAMGTKPTAAAAPSSPAPAAVEAKPAAPIQPTQEMPKVQDLE